MNALVTGDKYVFNESNTLFDTVGVCDVMPAVLTNKYSVMLSSNYEFEFNDITGKHSASSKLEEPYKIGVQ